MSRIRIPLEARVRWFATGIGVAVAGVGALALSGWALEVPALMSLRPNWIPMAPATALSLFFAGISLSLLSATFPWQIPPLLNLVRVLAAVPMLFGTLRLAEHAGVWSLGVDFLWFDPSIWQGAPKPAPVALGTALGLSLIGIALIVQSLRAYVFTVQILPMLVASVGWLGLGPYFYGGAPLLPIAGMAAHTAVCFFALSLGTLCARPDGGLVGLTLSDTRGGMMARWLLPPMLLLPVVFDALRVYGGVAGWFGPEAGQSLFGLLTAAAFGALIWLIAERLRVTELAQRAADTERARLSDIVENSDDAILGADLSGKIHAWNAGATKVFGYAREEVMGRSLLSLAPPDQADEERAVLAKVAEGEHLELPEAPRLRKDGGEFPAWVRVAPVHGPAGEVAGVSVIARDVGPLKQAERESKMYRAQFEQAQKMESIGRLAGGVAHDFNNLLTVINGYTEFALQGLTADDRRLKEDLEQVLSAGQRAAGLTRQLLAFSRRQVLRPEVVNMNQIVKDLEKMLRRLIGEDVEIVLGLADEVWNVMADPGQLEQVIMNLVVNARDAMPNGGRLTIETRNIELDIHYAEQHASVEPGAYVLLTVTDSGVGMDAATKARIFEPFFTTKEFGQGTGLGLATVYGIVTQSGGNIWVYSEPGHGTVFKVYLPRTGEALPKAVTLDGPVEKARGEFVLVVEDDDRLRPLTQRILTQAGYRAHAVGSGSQALAYLRGNPGKLDLLITDVVMPGMSGRVLAQQVSAMLPEAAILFMSGYTDDTIVRHGVLEKSLHFISKPFTAAGMLRAVRACLDGRGPLPAENTNGTRRELAAATPKF